jgi:hypothetical protein
MHSDTRSWYKWLRSQASVIRDGLPETSDTGCSMLQWMPSNIPFLLTMLKVLERDGSEANYTVKRGATRRKVKTSWRSEWQLYHFNGSQLISCVVVMDRSYPGCPIGRGKVRQEMQSKSGLYVDTERIAKTGPVTNCDSRCAVLLSWVVWTVPVPLQYFYGRARSSK